MSQSSWELVVDFLSYKLSQKGYSWNQFGDVEENKTAAPEGIRSEMATPRAINDNPSRHVADSPAVNAAIGRSSSLDALREEIPIAAVKQTLKEAGDEFERWYRRAFGDLMSELHVTPETAFPIFEQNGGWDAFVKIYGKNAAVKRWRGQEGFNRWFLMGMMTVTGVVLLGLFFSRK
ncbi:bcl-2-like protein 1 isoform X2 [Eulemur rufifrons]|uniref:bcl-2-like protein 1 isoform X2 n=1 Tax=Eulemur rufifrons TaxID=859984 RepID=UPI003742A93D